MASEFDTATRLAPGAHAGTFTGRFAQDWAIGPAVNGGVVMATAAAALTRVLGEGPTPHADPLAFSAHFLSAGADGDLRVDTEVLRRGRTFSTAEAVVTQDGPDGGRVERMRALATYGDLDVASPVHRSVEPVSMPSPEECVDAAQARTDGPMQAPPLMHRLDLRLDPSTAGWAMGKPSGRGQMRAWIRFADGRDADPLSLLFFLDAMPPVSFDLGIGGWAPTLEFSGHVRGRPAPGWLQMATHSSILTGGLMEEDALIWDSRGALVAQSRQLCSVRIPQGWNPPA